MTIMKFLQWVGSLIASTVGLFLILGVGSFFALFGGLIMAVVTTIAAVFLGAYGITEYLDERRAHQRKARSLKAR